MENELKGKKILILGGTTLMIHVVEVAKKLGVYTVVTDIDPKSPAKRYSDKSYDISTNDIDKLVNICIDNNIDGVFTGYEDFNTSIACELCEIINKPFYATKEHIALTKNKIQFKNKCIEFGVPVVDEYMDVKNIKFPVVTKPADSYSGKGITICANESELQNGIEFAKKYSKSNQYLIEKYMDSNYVECINIDYLIKDGDIKLSFIGDKYVNNEQGNKTPLTSAVLYPSKRQNEYIEQLDERVKAMFKSLQLRNGTLFIESFYDEDGFHFYEMGYRVGGGQSSILLNKICNIDYVEMLIRYALTGILCEDDVFDRISPNFSGMACSLVVLMKEGIVSKIEGVEKIIELDDVVKYTQFIDIDGEIPSNLVGTLGQVFARIHIVSNSYEKFRNVIKVINCELKVLDHNGNNLLLSIVSDKMQKYIDEL